MSLALFIGAFAITYLAARRSLGAGFAAVLAVGYLNGVLRANYLSVYTTLMFDASVGAFYLIHLFPALRMARRTLPGLLNWCLILAGYPTVLLFVPVHDPLVQLAGWRAEAWYLPLMVIASQLRIHDIRLLGLALALLNLMTLAVSCYLYVRGVEALYPHNVVTDIIYKSRDIAGGYMRIPSTFLNAHAYGGTMVMSFSLILGCLARREKDFLQTLLLTGGLLSALAGVMLCGARVPAATLILGSFVCWVRSGLSFKILAWGVFVLAGCIAVASTNPRLQRFFQLQKTEDVVNRAAVSANEHALDVILSYPVGAGLGAAVPSLPYFLAGRAPKVPGVENEYARLTISLGWPGLALWLGFLFWLYRRPIYSRVEPEFYWAAIFGHGMTLTAWGTALIGTGILTSIPASVLLLTQMGLVARAGSPSGRSYP